jgi:hypothetical protein
MMPSMMYSKRERKMTEMQMAVEILKTLKRQATALETLSKSLEMILDHLEGEVILDHDDDL